MAQQIYGPTLPSDTYGMLRLKVMGRVVAIVQHAHVMDNVDSVLSRSHIYYITHVGSVRIYSTFLISTMCYKLAHLINSKMLVLLCSPPRHPMRLSSGDRWTRNFNSKLPTAERIQQAARTLVAQVSAVVVNPNPFNTLRPQFVQLSTHDTAMLEPATAEDYARRLTILVKMCYTRQNTPVLPPVPTILLRLYRLRKQVSVSLHLDKPQQCSAPFTCTTMLGVNT